MSETTALVFFDQAKAMLEKAASIDEVKEIRDQAAAMQAYVRQTRQGLEMQNHCAAIKIRAERRAGELLAEIPRDSGGRPQKNSFDDQTSFQEAMAEHGIKNDQAHRWQTIASLPQERFEDTLTSAVAASEELTSAAVYREARRYLHAREVAALRESPIAPPAGRYRCLVIDPPWPMDKIEREVRPQQGPVLDYPTMPLWCPQDVVVWDDEPLSCFRTTVEPRCGTIECVVGRILAEHAFRDGCHVYLWVTHRFLPDGLTLFTTWGVTYQCLLTWVKNVGITPYSWMYDTEHVLFGRLGTLPVDQRGLRLSFSAPVQGHSVKPETFYERVRLASPTPRLEVFARGQGHEGFTGWGYESNADAV